MRRVLFLMVLCTLAPTALAQDPVKVDAKHYKVLLENDQVRVLRINYKPKEKSVMHEHPANVVVFLGSSQAKFTLADGSATEASPKAGEVGFGEAVKHLPENIGSTPVDAVLVELKGKAAMSSITLDPVKVDPEHHKVEFENDRVRVLRINFKPHDKTKEHDHPNGVAIFLTDVKAKFALGDGKTREGSNKRGEAIWAAAERHAVENVGSKSAEVILVELK
jgi:quercetin dioxygenase-like cupin family protein